MDDDKQIYEQSIDIHRDSLVTAISKGNDFASKSFLFPISITPTLREVVFVDTFLKIFITNGPTGVEFHSKVQRLNFTWVVKDSMVSIHDIPIHGSSSDDIPELITAHDLDHRDKILRISRDKTSSEDTCITFPSFYDLVLSPRGEFLLVLRLGIANNWNIDIFQDLAYENRPGEPNFQWIASHDLEAPRVAIQTAEALASAQSTVEVAFHSMLPQIAYAVPTGTYLWTFSAVKFKEYRKSEQPPLLIHDQPLKQMTFSPCGQRLHGFQNFEKLGAKQGIIINLPQSSSVVVRTGSKAQNADSISRVSLFEATSNALEQCVVADQIPRVQTSNTSLIARDANGIPTISTLEQSSTDNALILHTFNADGQSRAETLLRLPRSIANNGSITLLNPLKHKPGELRIVLEAAKKSYYTFDEELGGERLPAMIHRTIQSVPVIKLANQGIHLVEQGWPWSPRTGFEKKSNWKLPDPVGFEKDKRKLPDSDDEDESDNTVTNTSRTLRMLGLSE